ncbi:MAG: heme-binding protein [Solirubrobacteraceae bacterium]
MDPNLSFEGIPPIAAAQAGPAQAAAAQLGDPLGPLAQLPGTWTGRGFNAIWRPHRGASDHFLELNVTDETLVFTAIPGKIPNRGLEMPDISMTGVTYMQQISEENNGPALHIEPGIWAFVPATTNPNLPQTVVRMASIPHGTTILAQGEPQTLTGGPPHIPNSNITPFTIHQPNSLQPFPQESTLTNQSNFRSKSASVTQAMVDNPNSLLQSDLQASGQNMKSRVFLQITTLHSPVPGGGTSNTAFLNSASNPPGGNANAAQVDATFWIQTLADNSLQLQYTQRVLLNFNTLSWPHITVATLKKQ